MDSPRVLVVLGTDTAFCRGALRGFMAAARKQDWHLLHYHPSSDLEWLLQQWSPAAVVIGAELHHETAERFAPASLVSLTVDRSEERISSVCIDEEKVARLAARHLLDKGLRNLSTFRYDESKFAIARERTFIETARSSGANVPRGWGAEGASKEDRIERRDAIVAWLTDLPKPCGIFTCADSWGRSVARYAREAGLRVPEDIAIIGADNDVLECELISPPLSSVMIPWEQVGQDAATLVRLALSGEGGIGRRTVVAPTGVMPRRSTEILAIDDPLVARAISWIRDNCDRRLTVPMVAEAMGGGRQRLERRFRKALDRTIQEEIRRAHVERAKILLTNTKAPLGEVAERSGFSSASLLNAAFQREVGTPPGSYRRRASKRHGKSDDD